MTTLAVLTSGDRPYLAGTLAAVDAQDHRVGQKLLYSDGPLPKAARSTYLARGWELLEVTKTHADNAAAFRQLLDVVDGDLIFLEDDLELGHNALRFMAMYPIPPDVAFMSWFEATIRDEARPALYRIPCSSFVYSQALTLPARTLDVLRAGDWNLDGGLDSNIATILRGQLYGQHVPSLVQHVGRVSWAHPHRADMPRSLTFHGTGYNTMDLFPARAP